MTGVTYGKVQQITDAQNADIRADLYSLGGTLYYLLSGRPPFEATTLYEIYQAHISLDADPLNLIRPEVNAALAALIAKMMAKNPSHRFQTPGEVAEALRPFFLKSDARLLAEVATAPEPAGQSQVAGARPPMPLSPKTPLPEAEDRPVGAIHVAPKGKRRLAGWATGSIVAGALAAILGGIWATGILQLKTKAGVIAVENAPDDAMLFVDGDRITAQWPGGGAPLEISLAAGNHGIIVKKAGFTTFGEVVTVETGGKQAIRVRLIPDLPAVAAVPRAPAPELVVVTPPPPAAPTPVVETKTPTEAPAPPAEVAAQDKASMTPAPSPAPEDAAKVAALPGVEAPRHRPFLVNSFGMKLNLIPAGKFLMGSPDEHLYAAQNEKPAHEVEIGQPFYMSTVEVTNGLYKAITSTSVGESYDRGEMPVRRATWKDALIFCNLLSEREGLTPYYRVGGRNAGIGGTGYRLPREAEWEYACRGGTTTQFPHGDSILRMSDYAWTKENSKEVQPVGLKKPNAFGLYDMLGNVSEWCVDRITVPYGEVQANGPIDVGLESERVVRGGSYEYPPKDCRPAIRWAVAANTSSGANRSLGFRVVRDAGPDTVLNGRTAPSKSNTRRKN